MERSPSSQLESTPSEDHRNGSIFRRMYNSLHRPKKGSDPFGDIAERYEQERVREQRKKDVQQRPDHVKQKQHYTVGGGEDMEGFPKSQSWKGDIKSHFEWEPKTKVDTSNLATVPTTSSTPPQLQSASESHISPSLSFPPPKPTSVPKPLTRGHSLTASSVAPSANNTTTKRFSLLTDPLPSPSPPPPNADSQPLKTRGMSVPPKPNIPTFKEFRPEKREKVDMDELRFSYEQSSLEKEKEEKEKEKDKDKEKPRNGTSKRNPSRNSGGPDKPLNGVVTTIASSRLPSTILPGLQLLPTDEIRKPPMNRPRHPYIPKKADSSGSLFSGALRSSSAGKYSPRKVSPASADTTRGKSPAIAIKGLKKDPHVLAGSDTIVEPKATSPGRSHDLPRSHTESLTGAYGAAFRRQRSHHISNSPPTTKFFPPNNTLSPDPTTTSPTLDRPSSPLSGSESSETSIDGFVSIRRKPKNRNLKDSLTPASRSLLKSKAAEVKKMQMQVVTAKDLAAYSQNEGKLKLEEIFEAPEEEGEKENASTNSPASHRSLSTPTAPNNPSLSPPRRTLSSASSPAHIPLPPPLPAGSTSPRALTKGTTLYPKSMSPRAEPTATSPSPSPPSSPASSTSTSSATSPPPSPDTPITSPPTPTYPTATPSSPPYPKPPYMLAKTASKSFPSSKISEIDNLENPSPITRARVLSSSATIKGGTTPEPISEIGNSGSPKINGTSPNGASTRGHKTVLSSSGGFSAEFRQV